MSTKRNFNLILIISLISISILGYLPFVKVKMGQEVNLLFVAAVALNYKEFFKTLLRYKWLVFFLGLVLEYYLLLRVFFNNTTFEDFRAVFLGFAMFFLFHSIDFTRRQVSIIAIVAVLISIISSYAVIYYFTKSLLKAFLSVGVYFYSQKNQLAPLLSVSGIYLIYRFLYVRKNILFILLFAADLFALLVIQSKSNLVIVIVMAIILLLIKLDTLKKRIFAAVVISGVIITVAVFFSDPVSTLFTRLFKIRIDTNKGMSLLDKLSTGRISGYEFGFSNFLKNPVFGCHFDMNSVQGDSISAAGVHNVWLRALFYGGIVYFSVFAGLMSAFFKSISKYINRNSILLILILVGITVTMVEPTAPFGPGTSYILFWLLLGTECKLLQQETDLK